MTDKPIYITTAIPYVNAKPHLGHVLEWFQADAFARYYRLLDLEVIVASGADENSLKNVQAAEKSNVAIQDWLDEYAVIFADAYQTFGVDLDAFRRGSDQEKHWPGVQELWNRCFAAGDIYTKRYTGLYCVGCESFYTTADLVDGKCPEHLTEPEEVSEENYFFKLSRYQDRIKELIETDTLFITSEQFKNEMLGFLGQGLEDFSVSRSTNRARGIGVPVPNDDTQVMYVWFDALCIYLTAIGFGYDQAHFEKIWPADIHIIGKGINRFHSIYWIGMLLSAGVALPKSVSVHGYITANGQKMSKSLGNVIDPFELIIKYPLEHIRYYLLKEIPTHADGDFSYERFEELYTAELANGLGNLCSRVAKLCEKADVTTSITSPKLDPTYKKYFETHEISQAAHWIADQVRAADAYLSEQIPWKKSGTEQADILQNAVQRIRAITFHLQPFMPETAQTLLSHFSEEKIKALKPIFPRYE